MTHGSHRQVSLPITDEEIEKESDSEFFFPRIATLLKQKLHLPLGASVEVKECLFQFLTSFLTWHKSLT